MLWWEVNQRCWEAEFATNIAEAENHWPTTVVVKVWLISVQIMEAGSSMSFALWMQIDLEKDFSVSFSLVWTSWPSLDTGRGILHMKKIVKLYPPTRKSATVLPKMKPAMTSEQWFRYSETRLSPVRKAAQSVPRHNTGLASRLLFVLIVLVMYIWNINRMTLVT